MIPSRRPLVGCVMLALFAGFLAAQPPRKEEEEEPGKNKARPVVPVPVTEPKKGDAPKPDAIDPDVGTFKEEAAKVQNAASRDLFRALVVPYDLLEANFAGGRIYRVELLPFRELPEGELEIQALDSKLEKSKPEKIPTGSGFKFTPFELLIVDRVERFLARESNDRADQLGVASRALTVGLRWHLQQVERGKRVGKEWSEVEGQLRRSAIRYERERFAALVEAKKYNEADLVGLKLLTRNPDNGDVQRDVYWLQLFRAERSLKSPTDAELLKLREYLIAYERLSGKKDEPLVAQCKRKLRERATALVAEAEAKYKMRLAAPAYAALRTAEVLDPEAPGIANARLKLRGTVLYVGVPKLPVRMSPATARLDSEKWAVELMFEGPLQSVPEADVIRYRPALAESLPGVMPLGRSFSLAKSIRWSNPDGELMDARDVKGTLALLRRTGLRDRWCSDGLDVFHEIDRIEDPFKFRLVYEHGVLEPLGRATFKILPATYLQQMGKAADDEEFAKNPFGTGPFKYVGREPEGPDRECAVFRANTFYEQRPGKFGLPWIREIRFYEPDQSKLANDVTAGQLHVYPDCPADLAVRFLKDNALKNLASVVEAKGNRRIHMLAVNHRHTNMQAEKLRQGLSAAIDREAILNEVYRVTGLEKNHKALTGPFPVKSWATPPTAKDQALFKIGAGGLIAEGLGGKSAKIKLVFQIDNPPTVVDQQSQRAATKLKEQIEKASIDKGGKATIEVELVGLNAQTYFEKVHLEYDFDLALTTFDYRDDLYSLAGLLDADAAGRGGRNICGYLATGTNPSGNDRRLRLLIDEARQYRDFTKQVKEKMWDIHAQFNQRVPFIPLWQLDRFMVVHRDLELHFDTPDATDTPDRLDPSAVFTGVEMWRLK